MSGLERCERGGVRLSLDEGFAATEGTRAVLGLRVAVQVVVAKEAQKKRNRRRGSARTPSGWQLMSMITSPLV